MSDTSNYFQQLGYNALNQLSTAALNSSFSAVNDKRAWEYTKRALQQQFEYNKQMAELQNQYNLENWKMQNEYNSPAQQVARLVQAGLSPNLAYGQVSPGNASSAPVSVTPEREFAARPVSYKNFVNLSSDYFQLKQQSEQIRLMQKQQELMEEQRKRVEMQTMNDFEDYTYKMGRNYGYMLAGGYEYKKGENWVENDYIGNYFHKLLESGLRKVDSLINLQDENKNYRALQRKYQSLVNDWFKTERIFNYIDRGMNHVWKGIGAFNPKSTNINKSYRFGDYNNNNYYPFLTY